MTAIIDYKAGNLTSVRLAFESIGAPCVVTSDPAVIAAAERVVFPGVGAAGAAMDNIRRLGLEPAIRAAIAAGKPFLGICVGTQILFDASEEDGTTPCLGIIPGQVRRFRPQSPQDKVPHMGWNPIAVRRDHPLLNGIRDFSDVYFVHSFYPAPATPAHAIATTRYAGTEFASMVGTGNVAATQFHVEKSGEVGLRILKNFVAWDGNPQPAAGGFIKCPAPPCAGLTRRIIPCLDVINKRVTKGVNFKNNIDLGDPVELAAKYYADGCDELVVYDITASAEARPIDEEMIRNVARHVSIPFAVGGGIASLADMSRALLAGAEKVSVNSLAVRNPGIIAEGAKAFGSQCVVLGMDPVATPDTRTCPSGFEITVKGFRERTGMDAVEWARKAESLGAGEIVVNSVDADGTRAGFNLAITQRIADAVRIPVIASGGAGCAQHLADAFTLAHADAAIIAGMVHTGDTTIPALKRDLLRIGIPIRAD